MSHTPVSGYRRGRRAGHRTPMRPIPVDDERPAPSGITRFPTAHSRKRPDTPHVARRERRQRHDGARAPRQVIALPAMAIPARGLVAALDPHVVRRQRRGRIRNISRRYLFLPQRGQRRGDSAPAPPVPMRQERVHLLEECPSGAPGCALGASACYGEPLRPSLTPQW